MNKEGKNFYSWDAGLCWCRLGQREGECKSSISPPVWNSYGMKWSNVSSGIFCSHRPTYIEEPRTIEWLGVLCVHTGWGKKGKLKDVNQNGWITTCVGGGGGRVFQNPLFDSLDIRDTHKIWLQSIFGVFWTTQGALRPGPMQCFII